MPKKRSDYQKAAGKLISAIQKEWGNESGEPTEEFSEDVMGAAHILLQAGTEEKAKEILGPLTVRQYLGDVWVQGHPRVKPAISVIEELLENNHANGH